MITFKVSFEPGGAKDRLDSAAELALEALAVQVANDSNKYIPKDLGPLEASVYADSDFKSGLLIWGMEYAARLYYDRSLNLRKDKNPLASNLWFEVAQAQYMSEWIDLAERVYKMNL